ncbi:MAG: hypothetical protein JXR37_06265 [Kiritimatiellae bacterium]|nr:hypothetical protein [Kiritimatiellia bacterium]
MRRLLAVGILLLTVSCGHLARKHARTPAPRPAESRYDELSHETVEAMHRFRIYKANREREAAILKPFIKPGMSVDDVLFFLGPPPETTSTGRIWFYPLFYSSVMEIHFDQNYRVERVSL